MTTILRATLRLYQAAFRATAQSFTRCWIISVAVVIFGALMVAATSVAAPLGILGGFILGAVNALLIGATLSLIEQAVRSSRRLAFRDIWESVGQYFWDVIGVGFVLWVPIMLLERGMASNPNGPFLAAAIFLFLFILLNPAPEVIYQLRRDSPLDVMRESYEFVIQNWIEWFLPLVAVLAPLGLSFFFGISSRLGRGAGLDFFQVLILPFTLLTAWFGYLGLPDEVGRLLVLVFTPPAAVVMLIFRGHLFAALYGSSRRQRLFQSGIGEQ
ncbi:MAG: hypothetical protein ACREI2_02035 [Nitrospiraceae bacterium]